MWLVKLALRNPYTVGVLAAFLFLMGGLSIVSMSVDILPKIDIPVVNVIFNYPGLAAEEMENRVVFQAERGYTTSVNGIERIESRSLTGVGLIRVFFQPGTDIGAAIAQLTSSSLTTLRIMPPGIQPPTIVQFNASNVPVAQLNVTSDSIPEEKLFDYAQNFVRMRLFSLPGLVTPAPYGGKNRQINIDVRPELLAAKGLSPQDIVTSLGTSNLVIPAGSARIGNLEYNVILNSSPRSVQEFNGLPIKTVNGRTVTMGEVANISDSFADQTNAVRLNGKRATYLNILKKAEASTLDVVKEAREALPMIKATAPPGMKFKVDFDQSTFVRAAVSNVLTEGLIAAGLVSLMILFFLGSWRSVFIVCTSIPLSLAASICFLKLTGQTFNLMTLGGLSLAIGMLVDDATVEVENIDRNREHEPSLTLAILRGASQVALPAIMSTLSICIVFAPVVLLTGPARYLFPPMAMSVVFAMLASYVLSRTLVPTLARLLLPEHKEQKEKDGVTPIRKPAPRKARAAWRERFAARVDRLNEWREAKIDALRVRYVAALAVAFHQRKLLFGFITLLLLTALALPFFVVGRDFFPNTDAGLMKMHFRARPGTRIEETEREVARLEDRIRAVIPAAEIGTISSTIGMPLFYNLGFVSSDNIGPMDAEITVGLGEKHGPTADYQKKIRADLKQHFPGAVIYFQPADIVNQVLNFGQTATVNVQVEGRQIADASGIAQKLRTKMEAIPGAVDVRISQVFDYPTLRVNVDRLRASRLGLTQKDVASSMLISLSSSSLYAPSFFLNPENNVNYFVVTKVPLAKIGSTQDLLRTPITPGGAAGGGTPGGATGTADSRAAPVDVLGNLAALDTTTSFNEVSHTNIQRVVNIFAGVEDRDLGGVTAEIQDAVDSLGKLPAGVKVNIRGQSEVMNTAFGRLALGLVIAILLVYFLMVMLFQSWIDPFLVLGALPGALIGILWMLALTHTSLNVTSLMGSIMVVGIAVSNSILMVSFANDLRVEKNLDAVGAAFAAAETRLRPVLMTALAMIFGMLPMSLGLGEGGEQNAPLGRAVIGGLSMATLTTLFVVPVLYSLLRQQMPRKAEIRREMHASEVQFDKEIDEIQYGRPEDRHERSSG